MAWFRMESTFASHRKNRQLARILDISLLEARGLMVGLFCRICEESPDGSLEDWKYDDIADAAGWIGDPKVFVNGLLEVRFVIEGNNLSLEINDWMQYAEGYKAAERLRKHRRNKKRRRNVSETLQSNVALQGKETCTYTVTGPDQTGPDQTGPNNYVSPADSDDGSVSNRKSEIIQEIWDHYRSHHPGTAKVLKSDRKEYRLLKARLEDFDAGTLKRAIDGYHKSEWHQGNNDRGKKYLSFELIMRDISHVQAGLDYLTSQKAERNLFPGRPDMTNYDPAAKYRNEDGNI